jgi:ABC-type iron transport system FetAB ATPase subunit
MRNKIAQMMGKNDLFSSTLKEKMITDCQARGLDPNQVRAFIDNIGIPENKIDWI